MDFCKKKKSSVTEKEIQDHFGRTWIWTAIDAPTRLLITFWIGGRELEDARQFLCDLVRRGRSKPLFVSDELSHYKTVLVELFHKLASFELTGKRGRPRKPAQVIDSDLDYAVVHKTREEGRVVKVERNVVFGNDASVQERLKDSPSQTVNTAYVERSNLSWRLWDAHLVRKTIEFARSLRWLKAKFAICASVYNFVRPHGTLSRGEDHVFRPKTPAMAAGLTNRPWGIMDLMTLPIPCQ